MNYKPALLFIVIGLGFFSCKQITRVTDKITNPSARDLYARSMHTDSSAYIQWQHSFEQAAYDQLDLQLPYVEKGFFRDSLNTAIGYGVTLYEGEIFHAEIETNNPENKIFLDLMEITEDTAKTFHTLAQNEPEENRLEVPIEKSADFKLIIQPALNTETSFTLKIYRTPSYAFPVAGKGNAAIQSFWGAQRDGGRRSHEGLDIFADRGTPVVAACSGRVRNTGNRGLGGKQVWLRGDLYGNALYYAHLDSIAARGGQRVKTGDTLGFVGNTGNARTTPPHLHFGIYKSGRGAVNPQPFIFEEIAPIPSEKEFATGARGVVNVAAANLRAAAFVEGKKLGQAQQSDTLKIIGQSADWYHVRTMQEESAFIHHNLVDDMAN